MITPVLFKNRPALFIVAASVAILMLGLFVAAVRFTDPNVPLIIHFSIGGGIDFLGQRGHVFGTLETALAIVLINAFLTEAVMKKDKFLAYLLILAGLFASILIFLNLLAIMSVN